MADIQSTANSTTDPGEAELSHAVASLEGAAARAGLAVESEPDRAAEAVSTPETGTPDAGQDQPYQPGLPDPGMANDLWRRRSEEREARRRAEAQDRVLSEIARRLEEAQAGASAAPDEPEDDDPAPDPVEDWQGYEEWKQRQLVKTLTAQMDQRLKPILDAQERERQAWAERQQVEQRTAAERAFLERGREVAREATEIYLQTPEGQGFGERLSWYFGHPGDPGRGLPPQDGAMSIGLMAGGLDPNEARSIAQRNVWALQEMAVQRGLNPAYLIDQVTRAAIAMAAPFYGGGQAQAAYAAPTAQQPARQQSPAQQEVQQLRQTAKAGRSVAGAAPHSSGASTPAKDVAGLLRDGDITPQKIRALAAQLYGKADRASIAKVNSKLTQLVEEMRAAS